METSADIGLTPRLKARRNDARREKDAIQHLLDEAYQYAIPFRKSTRKTGQGEKRVDQVFDHTAIDSAFRFAGKVQQDLWPTGQENFALEPGPIIRDKGERDQMATELAKISGVLQAFFDDDGGWDMAFHEMALDLSAGTGAMLLNPAPADEPDRLWDPISVPIEELLIENGPANRISGVFWDRKMSVRVLRETWPEAKFGADLEKLLKDKPEHKIEVHTDTIWEGGNRRRWRMIVWCDKQKTALFESESRTCPWLIPRYFRVPGETYGRGPVMLAMPTIKTLNTAARLQLQAAAIAMLGIYTAVDDGVFNPDLAPNEPGVFWKVARNGGPLGPSVSRFPDPRLDLSNLVLNEMRMGVKATMMDQSLPPDGAAVRSATEILERVKRLAADHLGAYGRLVKEVVIPAVKRALEIAYNKGLIASEIPIDQLLVRVRVKSPLALAREAQRVEKIVQWLQMVVAMAGAAGAPQMARYVAKVEDALAAIGRDLGVPQEFIVTTEEREQLKEEDQAKALAAAGAAALTGASA
ncbi:portal protein [Stappia indica]|uniref:portal protein n=1 Tax=Stappia indica TaxID=538381 RepID=UPI001D19003D|nr:portal protein [Stappia indica]MCC4243418.1 portal protein [Stappia indica]